MLLFLYDAELTIRKIYALFSFFSKQCLLFFLQQNFFAILLQEKAEDEMCPNIAHLLGGFQTQTGEQVIYILQL